MPDSLAKQLVAHRGQQRNFPENSLAGLRAAAETGVAALEVDVQLSADGVAMLYHDVSLERVSGQGGDIFEYSAEQLVTLPAHEPERLGEMFRGTRIQPLRMLTRLLGEFPRVGVFVEMKPESVCRFGIDNCLQALHKALGSLLERCTVISFHREFVDRIDPHTRRGIVISDAAQLLSNPEYDVVFCNTRWLRGPIPLPQRSPLAVYEISSLEQAHYWLDRGARWIETHDVVGLLHAENLNAEKQRQAD